MAEVAGPGAADGASLRGVDSPRRFRAYNVGLIKTGTSSFSQMFQKNFRSRHEFMARPVYAVIEEWVTGRATEATVRAFIRARDVRGALEMDSAGFHYLWITLLVDEFPDARFILALRDCRSWIESLLNYVLDAGDMGGEFTGKERANLGLPFDLPYRDVASRRRLRPVLGECVPSFLEHWRDGNLALLQAIPEGRRLVVRTHEISQSLERVARFLGIDTDAIDATRAHSLAGARSRRLSDLVDRQALEQSVELFGAPIMAKYFPDFS